MRLSIDIYEIFVDMMSRIENIHIFTVMFDLFRQRGRLAAG